VEGHEFTNMKCENPLFCDGGEGILNDILGCSPFCTMGIMKGGVVIRSKGWWKPNLVCNVEEKTFDAKWKRRND